MLTGTGNFQYVGFCFDNGELHGTPLTTDASVFSILRATAVALSSFLFQSSANLSPS